MTLTTGGKFGFEKKWFVKAIRKIRDSPDIFSNINRARNYFATGPDKVKDLFQWLKAAGIIDGSRKKAELTPFGELLYKYDSYLNEYGSWIAILHNIGSYPHTPEIVYWYLNEFTKDEFTIQEFKNELKIHKNLSDTYISNAWRNVRSLFFTCSSLSEFRLLEEVDSKRGLYRKMYPAKSIFHPLAFGYCIIEWAKRNNKNTIHIGSVVSGKGLPGRVFNLPERYTQEKLNEIDTIYRKKIFDVDRTAGLDRIVINITEPLKVLEAYYEEVLNGKSPGELAKYLEV